MPNLMSSTLKFLYENTYCIHPMLSMVEQLNKKTPDVARFIRESKLINDFRKKKRKGKRGGW